MKASLPYKCITSVKNGKQYVVFDYKDGAGKRKRKWANTELPEKCTKKALSKAVEEIVAEFDAMYRTGELEKPKKRSARTSAISEPYAVMAKTPEPQMPMREYVAEWLTAMRPNHARTTYQTYSSANRRFVDYLDIHYPGITLGELRHNHVQEFLNHKLDEGCKGSAVKQYYLAIHSGLAYAVKMEYLMLRPMDKLVMPRADKYEATFYNKDELNHLFEVFKGDRLELVVHIAAYYGLRRSEMLGLRWDAIDFTNKTITIQRKVVSDYDDEGHRKLYLETRLKTNSTRRTLPLIPHIEEMLLEKKNMEVKFKSDIVIFLSQRIFIAIWNTMQRSTRLKRLQGFSAVIQRINPKLKILPKRKRPQEESQRQRQQEKHCPKRPAVEKRKAIIPKV